jgi:hypothetical protein
MVHENDSRADSHCGNSKLKHYRPKKIKKKKKKKSNAATDILPFLCRHDNRTNNCKIEYFTYFQVIQHYQGQKQKAPSLVLSCEYPSSLDKNLNHNYTCKFCPPWPPASMHFQFCLAPQHVDHLVPVPQTYPGDSLLVVGRPLSGSGFSL